MKKIHNRLSVQNSVAQDAFIAGVFDEIDNDFKELMRMAKLTPKPLMVCSGGTSTRCTANGHWTLDLRKNYQKINFDESQKTVEIGAGITMGNLLKELEKYSRTFPIGLSGLPGLGYILTGGISPLSRSQGLAIDSVLEIKGIWGNGKSFKIAKPTTKSSYEDRLIWRGLCGAAPFLGIVTFLTLKTQPLVPIKVWQVSIKQEQLGEVIAQAECSPNHTSLQWIWGDRIKAYGIISDNLSNANNSIDKIKNFFSNSSSFQVNEVLGLQGIPPFASELINKKSPSKLHSEVIGLLGPAWGEKCIELMQSLEYLISIRPNKNCFIAAQQLGGVSSQINRFSTSFIHRESIWKPWINASWQAGDLKDKERSLYWLMKSWETLEPHCPGIHLAQMHQHLPWHQKETENAFEDWLPGLQSLKFQYDPEGMLPRL